MVLVMLLDQWEKQKILTKAWKRGTLLYKDIKIEVTQTYLVRHLQNIRVKGHHGATNSKISEVLVHGALNHYNYCGEVIEDTVSQYSLHLQQKVNIAIFEIAMQKTLYLEFCGIYQGENLCKGPDHSGLCQENSPKHNYSSFRRDLK